MNSEKVPGDMEAKQVSDSVQVQEAGAAARVTVQVRHLEIPKLVVLYMLFGSCC